MEIAGEPVQVIHYPFKPSTFKHLKMSWLSRFVAKKYDLRYMDRRPKNNGQFIIHGHTHQKKTFVDRAIHVGVDSNNFKPIPIEVIERYVIEKTKK
jgi:calcineurin-like phosphoesterase family protein